MNRHNNLINLDTDFNKAVEYAVKLYKEEKLFIYPTEISYSIGADPLSIAATEKIRSYFGADKLSGASILISSVSDLLSYVEIESEIYLDKLLFMWPNAVDVIFRLKKNMKEKFSSDKISVRIPNNRFCLRLMTLLNKPLLSLNLLHNNHLYNKSHELFHYEYLKNVDAVFYTNKQVFSSELSLIDLSNTTPVILKQNRVGLDKLFVNR